MSGFAFSQITDINGQKWSKISKNGKKLDKKGEKWFNTINVLTELWIQDNWIYILNNTFATTHMAVKEKVKDMYILKLKIVTRNSKYNGKTGLIIWALYIQYTHCTTFYLLFVTFWSNLLWNQALISRLYPNPCGWLFHTFQPMSTLEQCHMTELNQ